MPTPPDLTRTLDALWLADLPPDATADDRLSQGCYISWDTKEGDLTLRLDRPEGGLLRLQADVRRAPRWFGLNLDIGPGVLPVGTVLGLAIRLAGTPQDSLAPFIRTGLTDDDPVDTPLTDPLRFGPVPAATSLLHQIDTNSPLAQDRGFHTLVLPLPKHSFTLDLLGLRLFALPPEDAQALRGLTLSGYAV